MAFDLTWPKVAALTTLQAGAQTAIGVLTTHGFSEWQDSLQSIGVSSVVAFLALFVAYKLPSQAGTAAMSAAAAAMSAPAATSATATAAHPVTAPVVAAIKPAPATVLTVGGCAATGGRAPQPEPAAPAPAPAPAAPGSEYKPVIGGPTNHPTT